MSQHRLQHKQVVVAVHHFHYSYVVDKTIAVEVEVRDHVARRVEYHLELLHGRRLCKSHSDNIQVKIQAEVLSRGIYFNNRRS